MTRAELIKIEQDIKLGVPPKSILGTIFESAWVGIMIWIFIILGFIVVLLIVLIEPIYDIEKIPFKLER